MGILDTAKAFARVGAGKAKRASTDAAAKGVHAGADAAGKGAASLNEAADKVNDDSTGHQDEPGRQPRDGDAPR